MRQPSFYIMFLALCMIHCGPKDDTAISNDLKPIADLYQVQKSIDSLVDIFVPDQRLAFAFASIQINSNGERVLEGETNIDGLKAAMDTFLINQGIEYKDGMSVRLPSYGLIHNSVAHFRSEPRHGSELVSQGLMGQTVRMYQSKNGWIFAQTPDDYLGWVNEKSITPILGEDLRNWKEGDKIIITSPLVFAKDQVRSGKITAELVAGNVVQKLGQSGNHTLIQLPDATKGYIPSKDCKAYNTWLENRGDIEKVLNIAQSYIGTPYLWGGTSGKGFDCSGFTKTAFYLAGFEIPRDASQQVFMGDPIPLDESLANIQRGDLLFFGRKEQDNPPKEKITHVAFYLGDKLFLHASGKVKIESLDPNHPLFAEDRLNSLLQVRRYAADSPNGPKPIAEHLLY